jgi:hypothetical protein
MSKHTTGQEPPDHMTYEDDYKPPRDWNKRAGVSSLTEQQRRDICGFDGFNSDTENDGSFLFLSSEQGQGRENRKLQAKLVREPLKDVAARRPEKNIFSLESETNSFVPSDSFELR